MPSDELITAAEAARILGVHARTVHRTPELTYYQGGPRAWRRYRRADVEAYRDAHTVRGRPRKARQVGDPSV